MGTSRGDRFRGTLRRGLLALAPLAVLIWLAPAAAAGEETVDLYDPAVLRTLELTFDTPSFFAEIDAISRSTADGYLTGDLTVDGILYPGVGVRFRGNTSQINAGLKRSMKIAVDHEVPGQKLYGYRTIKLNNSASDPTFLREALYSQACARYFPSPTANHVRLVINGESWGIYINVQQFNKDLLERWFQRTSGNRFKAPSGNGTGPPTQGGPAPGGCRGFACGDKALMWLGSDPALYSSRYELKSDQQPDPWGDLMRFCDAFNNTPAVPFEETVPSLLDADSFLWQIAIENIFGDHDGYLSKGADYTIYQEPGGGRLHTLQHDGNETFQSTAWGLLQSSADDNRPLVRRLLSVPQYRQRYLAHARTVLDEWFRWDVLGPIAEEMRDRIASEVERDTKKIYSTALFRTNFTSSVNLGGGFGGGNLPGLREFVDGRRQALLQSQFLAPVPPVIEEIRLGLDEGADAEPAAPVGLLVRVQANGILSAVVAHHAPAGDAAFVPAILLDDGLHGDGSPGDGVFGGEIPGYPAGSRVRYYVEARGAAATALEPPRAERETLSYRVGIIDAESTPVVINELMASNGVTIPDPQGEFDDWLELHNVTGGAVDLSGMYLTDKEDNPRKWRIPDGTVIPARGYLLIWLDEDGGDDGLHANFKLAETGELVWLLDTDERANRRLDATSFVGLPPDISWGRWPDGSGPFRMHLPTPGSSNGSPPPGPSFTRGDAGADGATDLSDAVAILEFLFLGAGPLACDKAADADDSGILEITDPVYLLGYLFLGGPAPPRPFGACGEDPTSDALSCVSFDACAPAR